MAVPVISIGTASPRNDAMRERYKAHAATLGALQDGFCRRSSYYGRTYIPRGHAEYIGPSQ